MKELPLHRQYDSLRLYCKINGSPNIEFILDTGCHSTVISKEVADILFLTGYLKDADIYGRATSCYGGVCTLSEDLVNFRNVRLGRVRVKNIKATICSRYGGSMLLGMSFLDALKDYSIKSDRLLIDDGKDNGPVVTNKPKEFKNKQRRIENDIKRLYLIAERSGQEHFKFDYSKHIIIINDLIQYCYPLLHDKKFQAVADLLEKVYPLLKENIAEDEANPTQRGAFITAYFHYHLATAYYQMDKREEAMEHYNKAQKFFLDGSSVLTDIKNCLDEIRRKNLKEKKDEEPALVPKFSTSLEEEVAQLGLVSVNVLDNIYGNGESKPVLIGFKDFKSAFAFSVHQHKRLEIIKNIDGKWVRTGDLPISDLTFFDLDTEDIEKRFACFCIENDLILNYQEIVSKLGPDNKELATKIERNKDEAIKILKQYKEKRLHYSYVILSKDDLTLIKSIEQGAILEWEDTNLCIGAFDVEPFITKKLEEDVLSGKYIPCAIGQMPEDFRHLAEQCRELGVRNTQGFKGDNNPDETKWIIGKFIILDSEGMPGYCYRETYDDVHWRWQSGEHSNIGLMETGKDINDNQDYSYCYWQLVREPSIKSSNIISNNSY